MLDLAINNVRLYPMTDDVTLSKHNSVGIQGGVIVSLEDQPQKAKVVMDGRQQVLLPGFIDCHTHALYAGDRRNEYFKRMAGQSYEQIAKSGGGISNTVKAVREHTLEDLVEASLPRVQALQREGVTTVEIKSGYGLDIETELKMLRGIRALDELCDANLVSTFLGAHAIPTDNSADQYLNLVIDEMLPLVAKENLATAVDIFVEHIAFDVQHMECLFKAARDLGFQVKAHAEQLSNSQAAQRAAAMGALSLDHLEYLDQPGIEAMAAHGTVAVMLPGAFYFLQETRRPPVEQLRRANVPMAVATDLNPGSSPIASLLTCIHMACNLFGLTPEECLLGVTINGARALGAEAVIGSIDIGKQADLTLWRLEQPQMLTYELGQHRPTAVIKGGKLLNLGYTSC
ncbi:MAG: imidazolonepropionase [Pseudomonadota bacterium]